MNDTFLITSGHVQIFGGLFNENYNPIIMNLIGHLDKCIISTIVVYLNCAKQYSYQLFEY